MFYNFVHLSFQELLAGYYMAKCLPDSEQVSQFQQLFHQPRFIIVFKFYAAITKLKTPGIEKIVTEVVSDQSRSLLLPLFHCLCEAQDPLLCQFTTECLEELSVGHDRPSPLDLLSIGYLISVSKTNVVKEVYLEFLDDCGAKVLMKHIIHGKGVEAWKFSIDYGQIHEEGAASIAKALQTSSLINSLELQAGWIGVKGLAPIAEALITNTSLDELYLQECSADITHKNGRVVAEMLQQNKTLRRLTLIYNHISNAGAVYIARGLEKNRALNYLKMSGITDICGKLLASAIATNHSLPLVELELTGHDIITKDSKQAFVDILQWNTSIETLELISYSDNQISCSDYDTKPVTVPFLAKGLQRNTTLINLILWKSISMLDMVEDVSRMLTVNRSVTSLDISLNPIQDAGVALLAKGRKQNRTLKELDISHCEITDAGVAPMTDALCVNKFLNILRIKNNTVLS